MGYVYAAMWLIAGLILIFRLSKENKIFYVAGGFFLVLGVWWLLDSLFPDWKVFQGTPGAVLKSAHVHRSRCAGNRVLYSEPQRLESGSRHE